MEYLDFDLQVGLLENGRYPVSVRSPAGEASDSFTFPYNEWQLKDKLKDLELALRATPNLRRALPPELQSVQDMGRDFFNLLLPGELRACFDVSQRMAFEQGKGLRVRLRLRSPELAALPWEYLYDPRQGEYLCLSTYTPIIRYLELSQPVLPLDITLPLRVLGMVCSPTNLAGLDPEQEKLRIEQALAPLRRDGLVDLHWLEGGAWRDLQRALSQRALSQRALSAAENAGAGWHIFHFIGHGDFDDLADEGRVAFVREDGKAHFLSATELARLLADHHALRLVVLNACEGARGSFRDAFSSIAATLVRRGIASVIAMQHAVSDQAAIELARAFYESLAGGAPVDTALGEARKAISLALPRSLEWGTPVLFMRAADGVLFEVTREGQIAPAPRKAGTQVNIFTGGGPYIEGSLSTGGGDIVGQDKALPGKDGGLPSAPETPADQPSPAVPAQRAKASPRNAGRVIRDLAAATRARLPARISIRRLAGIAAAVVASLAVIAGTVWVIREIAPGWSTPASPSALAGAGAAATATALEQTRRQPTLTPTLRIELTRSPVDGRFMMSVPAGYFLMGVSSAEANTAQVDEYPQHTISLAVFWIDRYEVTNLEYARCVASGSCNPPLKRSSLTRAEYYDDPGFANHPVVWVSWQDAVDYCAWAGKRLPTEAEWEKAARGPDGQVYPWGNSFGQNCRPANHAFFGSQTVKYCTGDTTAVGSHPDGASPYGVMDMAGNVWEWVSDWYDQDYYWNSPAANPTGPASGEYRVMRGGSFLDGINDLRAANRYDNNPPFTSDSFIGFRCADTP